MPSRQNMVAMGRQVSWEATFHIKLLPDNIQKKSPSVVAGRILSSPPPPPPPHPGVNGVHV